MLFKNLVDVPLKQEISPGDTVFINSGDETNQIDATKIKQDLTVLPLKATSDGTENVYINDNGESKQIPISEIAGKLPEAEEDGTALIAKDGEYVPTTGYGYKNDDFVFTWDGYTMDKKKENAAVAPTVYIYPLYAAESEQFYIPENLTPEILKNNKMKIKINDEWFEIDKVTESAQYKDLYALSIVRPETFGGISLSYLPVVIISFTDIENYEEVEFDGYYIAQEFGDYIRRGIFFAYNFDDIPVPNSLKAQQDTYVSTLIIENNEKISLKYLPDGTGESYKITTPYPAPWMTFDNEWYKVEDIPKWMEELSFNALNNLLLNSKISYCKGIIIPPQNGQTNDNFEIKFYDKNSKDFQIYPVYDENGNKGIIIGIASAVGVNSTYLPYFDPGLVFIVLNEMDINDNIMEKGIYFYTNLDDSGTLSIEFIKKIDEKYLPELESSSSLHKIIIYPQSEFYFEYSIDDFEPGSPNAPILKETDTIQVYLNDLDQFYGTMINMVMLPEDSRIPPGIEGFISWDDGGIWSQLYVDGTGEMTSDEINFVHTSDLDYLISYMPLFIEGITDGDPSTDVTFNFTFSKYDFDPKIYGIYFETESGQTRYFTFDSRTIEANLDFYCHETSINTENNTITIKEWKFTFDSSSGNGIASCNGEVTVGGATNNK